MNNHARLASETNFQPNELACVEEFKDEPDGFGDQKNEEHRHNMILQMLDDKIHKTEEKTRQIHALVTKAEENKPEEKLLKEISFAQIGD